MGRSMWDPKTYQSVQYDRTVTGSAFGYSSAQSHKPAGQREVHPDLDPKWRNQEGLQIRESRDSAEHPLTQPIAVLFDETGSMGEAPRILQTKLGTLMAVLLRKAYVTDPQLLFGAIGDAWNREDAPLQVGQFESGLEMDQQLDKIFLEGNGGYNGGETYGLALYFLARHSVLDCWERGKKGILILIGDERPHPYVTREEIATYIGDKVERDLPIAEVVKEVQKKYEVFFLHLDTDSAREQRSREVWTKLLGERVIGLDSRLDNISETIAMIVGLYLGAIDSIADGVRDLVDFGASASAAKRAGQALQPYATRRGALAVNARGHLARRDDDDGRGSQRL